jgi:mono/diheme cytochrome c family protein
MLNAEKATGKIRRITRNTHEFLVTVVLILSSVACSKSTVLQGQQAPQMSCGETGFQKAVKPILQTHCTACHSGSGPGSGSFASSDEILAYKSALSRITILDPANSLLVKRASEANHGGGCSACGAAFGEQLAIGVNTWAKGELGTASYCPANGGTGLSDACTNRFVDYFDPNRGKNEAPSASEITVVPAGLAYFKANMLPKLKQNCASCHVTTSTKAPLIPFADDTNQEYAYKVAKARVLFSSLPSSLLVLKPSTPNHGEGCGACGPDFDFYNASGNNTDWANLLVGWKSAEGAAATTRVELAPKPIPTSGAGPFTITWNGTDHGALTGITLSVSVVKNAITATQDAHYLLKSLKVSVAGTYGGFAHLDTIGVILQALGETSAAENPTLSAFQGVDVYVPQGTTNFSLSSGTQIIPIETEKLGFSFAKLEKSSSLPPSAPPVDESKGLTGLCTGKNLELFVKNVYSPTTPGAISIKTHCAFCHSPTAVPGGHPVVNFDSVGIATACLGAFGGERIDQKNPGASLLLTNPQGKNKYDCIYFNPEACDPPFKPFASKVPANAGFTVDPASPFHPTIFKTEAQLKPWMEWIQDAIAQTTCK